MAKVGTRRLWVCLLLSLAISLTAVMAAEAGLFDIFKSKKRAAPPVPKQSLVVFPFDQEEGVKLDATYGAQVARYLRDTLAGNDKYSVFVFSDKLSPIRRGDEGLTLDDAKGPFSSDKAKSSKLAKALATDFYLVGMVDDFQYDAAHKVAQLTLSAELVDARTGKTVGRYIVSGKADETSKATDEVEYRAVAAGKAVEALQEQLLPKEKPAAPTAKAVTPPSASAPAATSAADSAPPAPAADSGPPSPGG